MEMNRRPPPPNANKFQRQLAFGQLAESEIARWIMSRGHLVLPVYEVPDDAFKGPRVFGKDAQYVAPDIFVLKCGGGVYWIEAKHKSVFTWHRKTQRWTTGIDLHHYQSYVALQEKTQVPIWLLFLHKEAKPWDEDIRYGCPPECPTGLFGRSLKYLANHENHKHANHGRYGMVYWSHESLTLLATLEDMEPFARSVA